MALFRDRPDLLTRVKFYRVQKSHKDLPYATPFATRTWQRELGSLPLGQQLESVVYYNGRDEWHGIGNHFCGSAEQWTTGPLSTDPVPATNPLTGLPICCTDVAHATAGGLKLGGTSSATFIGHYFSAGGMVDGLASTYGIQFLRSSAGGLVEGGTSSATQAFTPSSAGGLVEGGTSEASSTYSVSSSGGLKLGGTSSATNENHNQSSSGGLKMGGTSDHNTVHSVSSSGGLKLGGTSSA